MVIGASSLPSLADRGTPNVWIEDIGVSARALRFASASIGAMPKMKTHSGAKKRFRKTAGGSYARATRCVAHPRQEAAKRLRRLDRPLEV